ncbi:thiamine-phosphate kinase [Ferrimonas gelatinilytica]|uniref:Thiamine-monophosphate kinase n=1 Tax=Ferrimonas gelatinilytica TaxID=1255257 RepID=A0ABP9S5D0_9GAMM
MWPHCVMVNDEFSLIKRYFTRPNHRKDVIFGVGDDAAVLSLPSGSQLVVSTDTLVEGTHFLPEIDPADLAYKAVAVNLSDLAAMGAEPAWMTLALTLPGVDEPWLKTFSESLFEIARYYGIALVGGDTTRGPLSITLTIHGHVPQDRALYRSGARVGDWIYVTGTLGDSAAGLRCLQGQLSASQSHCQALVRRHLRPRPRVLAGRTLRGLASSAMDLSDGLASDLTHILNASAVGAVIELDRLPLSEILLSVTERETALPWALAGGEDYELLFTVPEAQRGALKRAMSEAGTPYTRIGQITAGVGIDYQRKGKSVELNLSGYNHFEEHP